jgi:2-phosphoglycerate kinase
MANIYFIGGSPRVGKTQLTLKVVEKHPMFSISTDALRYALQQVYNREQKPALFKWVTLTG